MHKNDMRTLINIINEAADVEYTKAGTTKAKTAAGDFSKITATVSGRTSEKFTKLAKKFKEVDDLNKQIKDLRDEANTSAKKHIEDLFSAEDAVFTRYIETKSLVITMSKDQEKTSTEIKEVDIKAFVAGIYELVDVDLQPVIEKLLEVHTKISTKTRAAQQGRLTVKVVKEDTVFDKIKGVLSKLLNIVTRKMYKYDDKLELIKAQVTR